MTKPKTYGHRPRHRIHRKKRTRSGRSLYDKPRLDPVLKHVFNQIGVPQKEAFRPDPFQLEALKKVENADVLVSAPTGSGKTWIASEITRQYLHHGKRVWYASPLKALSNSIYQQFQKSFGSEQCGILTGDRKENPEAPIIVGTTEILRNQLYDAMHEGTSIRGDLVILDEAHYLSDPDRGVVWEEVLIYLPARTRLLLLSATISNGDEICEWLGEIRGTRTTVVVSQHRPVPLHMLFLFPDGFIAPLGGKKGLSSRVRKFMNAARGRGRAFGFGKPAYGDIIKCLRAFDLLPAIFFLKSRADCDKALRDCYPVGKPPAMKERFRREVRAFVETYPHLKENRQLRPLLECMVGSHHAGQLPYWKVLIETMMNRGYLEAIFSTSTVAAGVNFPARTVILVQSDRFDGRAFTDLTATELHQMIGRAGRRGKDKVGFALLAPGIHLNPKLIYALKDSSPEPLFSQIHINFSMTLNLLLSHEPMEVKDLLEQSLAAFQGRKQASGTQKNWWDLVRALKAALPRGACDTGDPFEVTEYIRKRAAWRKEARGLAGKARKQREREARRARLQPGRLFRHKRKGVYLLVGIDDDQSNLVCMAHNIAGPVRTKKGKLRLRKIGEDKIRALYDHCVELPEDGSPDVLQRIIDTIDVQKLRILDLPHEAGGPSGSELEAIRQDMRSLPCETCFHFKDCHTGRNKKIAGLLREFHILRRRVESLEGGLWLSFKRHVRFLKETGFVDEEDRLTPDGYWASKLRLDYPLLIADAIRNGALADVSPEIMAGCIAPFVWDRSVDVTPKPDDTMELSNLVGAVRRVMKSIAPIRNMKIQQGFSDPEIYLWPATALFLWAGGISWERLRRIIPVDEGDMASLIIRTTDHLRQVANLKETHPDLVATALAAIQQILREPVYFD